MNGGVYARAGVKSSCVRELAGVRGLAVGAFANKIIARGHDGGHFGVSEQGLRLGVMTGGQDGTIDRGEHDPDRQPQHG